MRKISIILILLVLSPDLFGSWFGKKKKPVVEPKEKPVVVVKKPEFCNYSLDIGEGVFFVFKGGCTTLVHEGIVNTITNNIIILDEAGSKMHSSDFETQEARFMYTDKKWGAITPIKFHLVK